MQPHEIVTSEQMLALNCVASAQIVALDVAAGRERRSMNGRIARSQDQSRSADSEHASQSGTPQRLLRQKLLAVNDLQEVLYCTGVPAILLDADLNVLLFTPATKTLFHVIASDIGRPLSALNSQAFDPALSKDAQRVLRTLDLDEREIQTESGAWYRRRIMPYHAEGTEGVVITFTDVSLQKNTTAALEYAKLEADEANAAKARALATASHNLRQPLQTLVLLQELLAKAVVGDKAEKLLGRFDEALGSMSSMLNALLDLNRIDARIVRAEFETFRIDAVLDRVTTELAYQAKARRIALRVLPCTLSVCSDPRLLEQAIRNLLANVLKFAGQGRVLVGCRRQGGRLSIQIWNDGGAIPEDQLLDIFEEGNQFDNSAQAPSLGRGLDLSVVQRLGMLMDHPVAAWTTLGKRSVFSINVEQSTGGMSAIVKDGMLHIPGVQRGDAVIAVGPVIYVVDGDREVRNAFRSMLEYDGHLVEEFGSAENFIDAFRPGRNACLLVEDNLPGISGLDLLKRLRDEGHSIPAIMVTARSDVPMAVEAMKAGASDYLEMPIHGVELLAQVGRALELSRNAGELTEWRKDAFDHIASLTMRQHQILDMVLAGHPSKNIAADLGISQRTVENHRASIMKKAGVKSLPALARLALAAAGTLMTNQSLAVISEVLTV
jgi:two-component system CheB/CheR fusion protein